MVWSFLVGFTLFGLVMVLVTMFMCGMLDDSVPIEQRICAVVAGVTIGVVTRRTLKRREAVQ